MRISRHRQVFHVYSDRLKWNKQVVNIHMHIVYHIHFPTLSQIWNCLTSLFIILQILFNSQLYHVLLLFSCHLDVYIYKYMYVFAMSFVVDWNYWFDWSSSSIPLLLGEKAGMDGTLPPTFLPGWHNEEKVVLSPFHTFENTTSRITLCELRFDECAIQGWVKPTF